MSQSFTCPKGHEWEDPWGDYSVAPDHTIACPVCGEPTKIQIRQPATPDLPTDKITPTHSRGPTADAPLSETLALVNAQPPGASGPPAADAAPTGYDILGELGRGGMGVVYKARHHALKRNVALKMVLGGGHNTKSLARFQTEAEAVARLQHPNIVQIYEVGQRDGLPYFAMEFVDGTNLIGRTNGNPQPAKDAARFVATLARAMHAAHECGIVHRDLKPGNVLVARDGTPKITDFGLAKKLDESDGQTQTGDVMGTPSYMAPEQAMGKIDAIGPATDVYALGAILYEMLTARPPFKAETAMDTMFQVLYSEPVPPARLRAKMPRDLETIVMKCLEKETGRRYPTALALAEDLERYTNDQPIAARPVGPWGKLTRWAKRRPAQAALVGVSALAFVAALVGSLIYNVKQQEWVEQEKKLNTTLAALAESEKKQANVARTEREKAVEARDFAIKQEKIAEKRRAQAEANFRAARQAVQEMLNEVGNKDLVNIPLMDGVRKRILGRAIDFHRGFIEQKSDDPAVRFQAAQGLVQVAELYSKLGDASDAEKSYAEALVLFHKLLQDDPKSAQYAHALGDAALHQAELLRGHDKYIEAETACRFAVQTLTPLVRDHPQQADYRRDLGRAINELGFIQRQRNANADAEKSYQDALDVQRAAVKQFPDSAELRDDLAGTLNDLGALQRSTGNPEAAEKAYREALAIRQKLSTEHPDVAEYRRKLAATYSNLGNALRDLSRGGEAEEALLQALPLWKKLAADFPATLSYRQELANTHTNLGAVLATNPKRLADAEEQYQQALAIQEKLVSDFPAVLGYRSSLAAALDNLAGVLSRQGRGAKARELLERSRALHDAVLKEKPNQPLYRRFLRNHYATLAEANLRPPDKGEKPRYAEAAAAAEQLPKLYPDGPDEYFRAATIVARCVPPAQQAEGKTAADRYAVRAVQLLQEAVARGYKDASTLRTSKPLMPLADREDFKKLVEELEKKQK